MHRHWSTNKRQHDWNQIKCPNCPFCKTEVETRLHIFQCTNQVAKTYRTELLVKLRKKLQRIQTSPFITNHIIRCLHQFHGNFSVSMINSSTGKDETEKLHMNLLNHQISFGIDNLLSGTLTVQLSEIQKHFIKNYNVGKHTSIWAWNRNIITCMLDHANDIWKYRSEILHEEEETTMREQAIHLLLNLRKDPYQIPFTFRNLLNRTRQYLRTTHMGNVRSWLNRITYAVELGAGRRTNGVNDIRWWIHGKSGELNDKKRLWGEIHGLDSDYDSDDTEYDILRYPDENPDLHTWIKTTVNGTDIEPTVDNENFLRSVDNSRTTPD